MWVLILLFRASLGHASIPVKRYKALTNNAAENTVANDKQVPIIFVHSSDLNKAGPPPILYRLVLFDQYTCHKTLLKMSSIMKQFIRQALKILNMFKILFAIDIFFIFEC